MNNQLQNKSGKRPEVSKDWVQSTRLFSHWSAMKEQIMLHKWYESEKAGHDIGWEKAAANWMIHHRSGFSIAGDQGDS